MKVCREGWPFIFICGGLAAIAATVARWGEIRWLWGGAGILGVFAGFCLYFFRDPSRSIPRGEDLILSPADGRVLEVIEEKDAESGKAMQVVRIFLSLFDPHLQRSPIAGRIRRMRYTPGKFLDARDPQAAAVNEQNRIEIEVSQGQPIVVTQIAGFLARRIVAWVNQGQRVAAGDKLGLIRFGSQVDIGLPLEAMVMVKPGDRVRAGESVIGQYQRVG